MTIVKIYLDDTKYFEIGSPENLSIKDELPIPKFCQIYQFHIFYKSGRGYYKLLENNIYFIYKDNENNRHLYQQKKRNNKLRMDSIEKISNISFTHRETIKIFMKHSKDFYLFNISINNEYSKHLLSETDLSKENLLHTLFKNYIVEVHYIEREECRNIMDIDMHMSKVYKKNIIDIFKQYILNSQFSILFF
jgi:hypothetical protein